LETVTLKGIDGGLPNKLSCIWLQGDGAAARWNRRALFVSPKARCEGDRKICLPLHRALADASASLGTNWMSPRELLSHEWLELTSRHHCETSSAQALLDELLGAYSEPNRRYHTIEHIASLLQRLDDHGQAVVDRDAVALAILFHDVIYDPRQRDNEEKSAAFARGRLALLGFHDELVAKVELYIHATKHAQDFATSDRDLSLLLDLDLSTLAVAPAEYLVYADAIRREFGDVPDELYRPARRRVLEGFLAREWIYRTDDLRALWEERARANIAAEISDLA
jgi:predicted metal-dependent HD superfamily phosphohydrolase